MSEDNSETISLHKAISDNDYEMFQLLIEKGADINLPDSKGLKPLHLAIMTNNARIAGELLTVGRGIKLDMHVFELAIRLDNTVIWNLLKNHYTRVWYWKVSSELKDSQGETLIHYSVKYRSFKILNQFIDFRKLNINDVDVQGYSPLHLAVINNDVKIVELLLKSGADVCAKTLDGRSSIHFAVQYQCFETLLILIDSNVDVNDPITSNGVYPLHMSVENNDERIFNILVRAGGDIHCKDKDGKNVLHVAIENEHEDMINILLKKGVDVNARFGEKEQSAIELALIHQNSKIISAILNYNPDLNSKNKDGLNALFIAVERQCLKAIKEMFSLKPDLSAVNNDNTTLLHYAFIYDIKYVVKYFLNNNININAINNEGRNALHYAADSADTKVVSQLIRKGLDVNSRTSRNLTPLHFAVRQNCTTVETLLNNGADINAEDVNRQTPLHYALRLSSCDPEFIKPYMYGNISKKITKLLLDKGANVNLFDNTGNTPLYYLMSNPHLGGTEELILFFIQRGANINNITNRNDNILHIFLKHAYKKSTIDLFLDNGGNINQVNNSNQTSLEVYLESGRAFSNTLEFFINKGAVITKNNMGENALHLAVKASAEKALEVLLEKNFADIHDKAVDGSTVLHYAIKFAPSLVNHNKDRTWNDNILNMVLNYNVDLNVRDNEGKTPLHLAVIKDAMNLVKTLLSNNYADINIKDILENSPLCYAIFNKNLSMIKLLLQNGACTSDRHRGLSIYDLAEQTGDKHVYHMIMFFFKND